MTVEALSLGHSQDKRAIIEAEHSQKAVTMAVKDGVRIMRGMDWDFRQRVSELSN